MFVHFVFEVASILVIFCAFCKSWFLWKMRKFFFKVFQLIQTFRFFCPFFPIGVVLRSLFESFLNNKTSANLPTFMIFPEDLFFIYRGNLSTHMKGSLWNFCFVVKLCVQMIQSVQEISLLKIFLLTQK